MGIDLKAIDESNSEYVEAVQRFLETYKKICTNILFNL